MMNAPHLKRDQRTQRIEPYPTATKRARFSLDRLDDREIPSGINLTSNGNWDQLVKPTNVSEHPDQFDIMDTCFEGIGSPILEHDRLGADLGFPKNPSSSSQPIVLQDEKITEVCYGAVWIWYTGLFQISANG